MVAKAHGATEKDLVKVGRVRKWVIARSMLVYLGREWCRLSVKDLAKLLHRDSSVMAGLRKRMPRPIAWRRSTVQQFKVQRSGFSKIRRRSFSPFHGDWVQQFKTRGERSRKTSIVGERILFNPIFNAQSAHSFEFPFIIRHEPNAKTQGLGRNQQIHGTNRPS
jgi:hypothetical protein